MAVDSARDSGGRPANMLFSGFRSFLLPGVILKKRQPEKELPPKQGKEQSNGMGGR